MSGVYCTVGLILSAIHQHNLPHRPAAAAIDASQQLPLPRARRNRDGNARRLVEGFGAGRQRVVAVAASVAPRDRPGRHQASIIGAERPSLDHPPGAG